MPKRKPKDTTEVVASYYADGRVECALSPDYRTLIELQAFVGGYIEMVPTTIAHRSLIVNEEGLLSNLPFNAEATKLVKPGVLMLGGLRGNALLVKS